MNFQEAIRSAERYVQQLQGNDYSGHGWDHIWRVRNLAIKIAEVEGGDKFIVEMAALLHDVGDPKLHHGDESKLIQLPMDFCRKIELDVTLTARILGVIQEVSFKGAKVRDENTTIESKIVQDADRLDAIGAIGIARCFYFGGHHGRELYNPDVLPQTHASYDSYRKSRGTTINHFHEKLLLLKDRMHTYTARVLAEERHLFVQKYLSQFDREWYLKD
ncbi:MAG: HD domain-containing protein [Flavobacteriales bacterium]